MLPDRSKYTTVADVIKVDNDQAWNALLDHCSIERIVLFDDPAKAERAMKTGRQNVMRAGDGGWYDCRDQKWGDV